MKKKPVNYIIKRVDSTFCGYWMEAIDGPLQKYIEDPEYNVFEMDKKLYSQYQHYSPNIRFRTVSYWDPGECIMVNEYEIETYGRARFFGLFRDNKWVRQIQTKHLGLGLTWCEKLMERKALTKIPVPHE